MISIVRVLGKFSIALLVVWTILPAVAQPQVKTLADGVTLIQDINIDPAAAMVVNVLKVDPKKPGVKIGAALGGDTVIEADATKGRETISRLVARKAALAGVNADFFPWNGDPLGFAMINGELVSEPMSRAAVGIAASGLILFDRLSFDGTCKSASGLIYPVRGINRPRGKAELVLFTPIFGKSTGAKDGVEVGLKLDGSVKPNTAVTATVVSDPAPASGAIITNGGALLSGSGGAADWLMANIHAGDRITLRLNVKPMSGGSWDDVVDAVGGGPWLVRDGQVYVDSADQNFKPDITVGRNPRTAVGVTSAGELLLVTVDGRQSISRGMSLQEMATLMKSLGAVQAINLDGGGSTTLSVKGIVINSPSGGSERPVANALLVYGTTYEKDFPEIKFADCGSLSLTSSDNRLLGLIDASTGQPVSDALLSAVIWGTKGGIGFVNQKGYFTPFKTGTGTIVALLGGNRLELPVTVLPSQPAKLTAKVEPDPSGTPNLATLSVSVLDAKGNGVPDVSVTVSITGGTVDAGSKSTDAKGASSFTVTLDSTLDAVKISVSAAGMSTSVK